MKPISSLEQKTAKNLLGVLTDIDDTITTDGRLPAKAYTMLERLQQAGLLVIPITGRPAGWCDMVARFWPVAGVVGENGALAFRYDRHRKKMVRLFAAKQKTREQNRRRLSALAKDIIADVPGAAVASDQLYREADLAIDFCEDVPALEDADVQRIVSLFLRAGAVAKVSSIHVNGWFGNWDKLSMTKTFLQQEFAIDIERSKERFVYCGDSPNDSPMFSFFPNACGVANVKNFMGKMEALPDFIAESFGAEGFVEIGERIISHRKRKTTTKIEEQV